MFNVCTIKKLFARKGKKQFRSLISKKKKGLQGKKKLRQRNISKTSRNLSENCILDSTLRTRRIDYNYSTRQMSFYAAVFSSWRCETNFIVF